MHSGKFRKETDKYKNEEHYLPNIETRKEIAAAMKVNLPVDKVQRKLYKILKDQKSDVIKMLELDAKSSNITRPRRVFSAEKDAEKQKIADMIEAKIISKNEEDFEVNIRSHVLIFVIKN